MAKKGFSSVTISEATNSLVVALAEKKNRSKAWVIEESVKHYIDCVEGGEPAA